MVGWLCWGLTSLSTIFQSCRDGAIASWVINQYFRGVKCLAQGHNTAEVGLEPRTSRSGVRHSTTEPPRSPPIDGTPLVPSIYPQDFWDILQCSTSSGCPNHLCSSPLWLEHKWLGQPDEVPKYFYTDRSRAVLLLWFLTVLAVCIYTLVQLLC